MRTQKKISELYTKTLLAIILTIAIGAYWVAWPHKTTQSAAQDSTRQLVTPPYSPTLQPSRPPTKNTAPKPQTTRPTPPSNNTPPLKTPTDTLSNHAPATYTNPLIKKFEAAGLQNVQAQTPSVQVNLRYAGTNNFTKKNLYGPLSHCYLHPQAAAKLNKAQAALKALNPNYSLLLFDCARPFGVQKQLWEAVKNTPQKKYVAPPASRSMHNYGMAVDITIVNLSSGQELDMGTPYDYFGPEAQPRHEQEFFRKGRLTQQQLDNRHLLKKVMKQGGFRPILLEWWHFEAATKAYTQKNCPLLE